MSKGKLSLEVKPSSRRPYVHKPGSNCCRTHMVICPGYGSENFDFPTVQEAVTRSLSRLDKKYGKDGEKAGSAEKTPRVKGINLGFTLGLSNNGSKPPQSAGLIAHLPGSRDTGVDATLFAAAEGIRLKMEDGKYDAIVAERFDDHVDKVTWAKAHLANREPKYRPAIDSLEHQLNQLRELYHDTLPRVLAVLAAQNPDVHEARLLDAAVEVLDEELIQILSVLRIWTDAFGQMRSDKYKQLEAVVFAVEQAFRLFEGEEPVGPLGEPGTERLRTSKFHIGNVFVARFSDQGPATLPGTRGPVGAHAIEVPHDERNIIALMLVLYMHEFRHDIFADVEGLADEVTMAVARAISEACESGRVKLSQDKVKIGRSTVRMADLLVKFAADTISEVDADIYGILLSGGAYLYNMLSTFSAFNSRKEGVFNKERLLRVGSYYGVREMPNGQRTIEFWPHPPDYLRAYIISAGLDLLGFKEWGEKGRQLADQGVGTVPEYLVWQNEEGKDKGVIRIPTADLKAIAPVIVEALINTPLEALGGLATHQVINWNEHRQKKVDLLVEILMSGKSDVPEVAGDIYATYVAAAATLAYWGLVKSGVPARKAAVSVDANALRMLDTVKDRFRSKMGAVVEEQSETASPPVSEPVSEEPDELDED